jgi:hypothetical protein
MRFAVFVFFLTMGFLSCVNTPKEVAPVPKPVIARPVDKDILRPAPKFTKTARKSFLGMFPRSRPIAEQLASVVAGFDGVPFVSGTGPYDLPAPNQKFVISFENVKENTGPLKRYSVFLKPDIGQPKQIGEVIGWVAISPDSKYVAREPLTLINVSTGEAQDLSGQLGVTGFVNIHFWSANGKSFIVSQTECAFDCPKNDIIQYWRIDLL